MKDLNKKIKKSGFSVVEIIIAIGIGTAFLLMTMVAISLTNAKTKGRDSRRVESVKQIQVALELFFGDKNRYPTLDEWNTGKLFSTSTLSTTTYIAIPEAPNPPDGDCTTSTNEFIYNPTPDGTTYNIAFCLGGQVGSMGGGQKCATLAGIIEGGCN
jgi:type II secretory pathway pseudopilin PulG